MNFEQIIESLPNGLHDAELRRLNLDFVQQKLVLDLDVWIGDLDASVCEIYRPARLCVDGVAYFVVEPPDSKYSWNANVGARIDAGVGKSHQIKSDLPAAPDGTSAVWIFVERNNSFILFSAKSAMLEWIGYEYDASNVR